MESELLSGTLSDRINSSGTSHYIAAPPFQLVQDQTCKPLQKGSFLSCFLTLSASIGGSGMLAMPYAFQLCGWPAAVCTVVLGMLINLFTCYIVLQAATHKRIKTMDQLFCDFVEREWANSVLYKLFLRFTELSIFLNNYGSLIAYMIVVCGIQTENLIPRALQLMGVTGDITSHYLWGPTLSVVFLLPLSNAKNISDTRYQSLISFLSYLYVPVLIIADYFVIDVRDGTNGVWTLFGQLQSISLILFAYGCQSDWLLIAHVSHTQGLENKEQGMKIIVAVMLFSMSMLLPVGLLGYLTYPQSTPENILQGNHYNGIPTILVTANQAMLLITISLVSATPVMMCPVYEVAHHLFGKHRKWSGKMASLTSIAGKSYAVLVLSATAVAIFSQQYFSFVIGIVGAVTSSYLCIILPCVWYLRCTPEGVSEWVKYVCFFVLISSSCICSGCILVLLIDR